MGLKSSAKRSSTSRKGNRPRSSSMKHTQPEVGKIKARNLLSEEPDSDGFYDTIIVRSTVPVDTASNEPSTTPAPKSKRATAAMARNSKGQKSEIPHDVGLQSTSGSEAVRELEHSLPKNSRISRISSANVPAQTDTVTTLDSSPIYHPTNTTSSKASSCRAAHGVSKPPPVHIRLRVHNYPPAQVKAGRTQLLSESPSDAERNLQNSTTISCVDSDTATRSALTPFSARNRSLLAPSRDTDSSCEVLSLAKPGLDAGRETQTSRSLSPVDGTHDGDKHADMETEGDLNTASAGVKKLQKSQNTAKKPKTVKVRSTRPVAGVHDVRNDRQRYRLRVGKNQVQYYSSENGHEIVGTGPERRVRGPVKGMPGIVVTKESKYAWPREKMPVGVNLAMATSEHGLKKPSSIRRGLDDEQGRRIPNVFHSVTFQEEWALSYERPESEQVHRQNESVRQTTPGIYGNPKADSKTLLDTIVVAATPDDTLRSLHNPPRTRTPSLSISTASEIASTIGEWYNSSASPVSPPLSPTMDWQISREQPSLYMLKHDSWPTNCEDEMSDVIMVDVMDSGKKSGGVGRVDMDGDKEWVGCELLLDAAQRMDVAGILVGWGNIRV